MEDAADSRHNYAMWFLMKKVNCAEGMEQWSLPVPARNKNALPPICLALIGAEWYVFLQVHCLFLMAALHTSQMDARWNGESGGIVWPRGVAGMTAEARLTVSPKERNAELT